ncbi:uncharacterized protein MEPE_05647 [Melanopsichium pennsylvanicum]|uniref:Uncharacterized protein n=1 Tax=Melanopsichium pennsylvanicum TaxID=63383 RepID=A0AAJ5C7V6_9BASI|nr:uncharacterized protein MEPE_05647 [Melanopsichium pennsylvanicum]
MRPKIRAKAGVDSVSIVCSVGLCRSKDEDVKWLSETNTHSSSTEFGYTVKLIYCNDKTSQ